MADAKYSNMQKISFAGLVLGFVLCVVGGIVPYWQEGKISINPGAFIDNIIDVDVNVAKMHGGLWWYCMEASAVVVKDEGCEVYDMDKNTGEDWAIRIAVVVNVLLSLLCALAALCRSCCCGGGRTVCHGIMAFIAGAAGFVAVGVFASTAHDGFIVTIFQADYGWGFYIYAIGSGIVTVSSFMLCFASPDNPITPVILSSVGSVIHTSQHNYSRMPEHNMPMEQPGQMAHYPPQPQAGYPQTGYPQA